MYWAPGGCLTNTLKKVGSMLMRSSETIITQQVLNENTGELEHKKFVDTTKYVDGGRGGWSRMYKDYDSAVIDIVSSKKDLSIVISIRDSFSAKRIENVLSKTDIAKEHEISMQKATKLLGSMVTAKLLKRVARGVYRLNPFMYLPLRANAAELQKEWKDLPYFYEAIGKDETLSPLTTGMLMAIGTEKVSLMVDAGFKPSMPLDKQHELYNKYK